jgi:hypothetical protein
MTYRLNMTERRAPLNILRYTEKVIRVSDAVSKKELKEGKWMEREWFLGLENVRDNNKSTRSRL